MTDGSAVKGLQHFELRRSCAGAAGLISLTGIGRNWWGICEFMAVEVAVVFTEVQG